MSASLQELIPGHIMHLVFVYVENVAACLVSSFIYEFIITN